MSEKFTPVDVRPQPCTDAQRDTHLRAFVASFVAPLHRSRCLHILIDAPHKARYELHKLEHWLAPQRCRKLAGSAGFPRPLHDRFGTSRGVYFDEEAECCMVTAAEAATLAAQWLDAIFSLVAGELALFFHHDDGVYLCEKRQ